MIQRLFGINIKKFVTVKGEEEVFKYEMVFVNQHVHPIVANQY
jgi:hypothetical protein